jgi:hypothetical protein
MGFWSRQTLAFGMIAARSLNFFDDLPFKNL